MPFVGCADIGSKIAAQYHQEVNWLKLGRMPAVLVIDKTGRLRFVEYGESMSDIPPNDRLLNVLDQINGESQ